VGRIKAQAEMPLLLTSFINPNPDVDGDAKMPKTLDSSRRIYNNNNNNVICTRRVRLWYYMVSGRQREQCGLEKGDWVVTIEKVMMEAVEVRKKNSSAFD